MNAPLATRATAAPVFADAPAVHFDVEPFHVFAHTQLAAYPLAPVGICLNPHCSREFVPRRDWQRYCSAACRQRDELEMRKIGQKAAPALLAHQMGKYEKHDAALRALSSAGRNYVSRLQSAWLAHRRAAIARARGL